MEVMQKRNKYTK